MDDFEMMMRELQREIDAVMNGEAPTLTAHGLSDFVEAQARRTAAQAVASWIWCRTLTTTVKAAADMEQANG